MPHIREEKNDLDGMMPQASDNGSQPFLWLGNKGRQIHHAVRYGTANGEYRIPTACRPLQHPAYQP